MNYSFLFRVDSGKGIGVGHISRCQTLAIELIEKGHQVYFLSKTHIGNSIKELDNRIKIIEIESNFDHTTQVDHDYSTWNCENDEEEFKRIQSYVDSLNLDFLILDHYGIGEAFDKKVRSIHQLKYAVIDDLYRNHDCDILINQNYGFTKEHYQNSKASTFCLGPSYSLLQKDFVNMRESISPIKKVENILIFFGGNDLTDETYKVVNAFTEAPSADIEGFQCNAFISKGHERYDELIDLSSKLDNFQIHQLSPEFKNYLYKCDVFFGASGTTNWERCCLGKPTFLVTIADNQKQIGENLSNDGIVHHLGSGSKTSPSDWLTIIKLLKNDVEYINNLAQKSFQLVDGLGTQRVADKLIKELI